MKKVYSKPLVAVESLSVNLPIALNCMADFDDMNALIELGYFGANDRGIQCGFDYTDGDGTHDTICYHSNVQQAFLS